MIRRVVELAAGRTLRRRASPRAPSSTRACSSSPQVPGFFPDLQDERVTSRAGARPLALLNEHLPELGARPPVPRDRPQRRDQHAAGQRQLDARPRESQLASELFGDDLAEDLPGRPPRRLGLGDVRQRARAADARRPLAAARGDDDDPGGLPRPRRPLGRAQGLLRVPLLPDGAVGRPRRRLLHRRPRRRRDARPQRPAPRAAGSRPTTATSILGSEVGVLDIAPENVVRTGRLQPGKLFLVDLEQGRIVEDEEVKRAGRHAAAVRRVVRARRGPVLPTSRPRTCHDRRLSRCAQRHLAFGYSQEDLRVLIAPMAAARARSRSARWATTRALAVLSDRQPPLFSYFKQLFAQVTNPPIDPIRESDRDVRSATGVGIRAQPARRDARARPPAAHGPADPAQRRARDAPPRLPRHLPRAHDRHHLAGRGGPGGHGGALLAHVCDEAHDGDRPTASTILILSDRRVGAERVPIPSLLAVAAVHHHLVREGTRLRAGLVLESGEPREVHHIATLIGYGASAINPYLMLESRSKLVEGPRARSDGRREAEKRNVVKAIGKGLLKTISKMGISTIQSYCGAQIFEAVGLVSGSRRPPLHRHGVAHRRHRRRGARAGGARASRARLRAGRPKRTAAGRRRLRLAARRRAPRMESDPVALLQNAVRAESRRRRRGRSVRGVRRAPSTTRRRRRATLRGLLRFKCAPTASQSRSTRSSRVSEIVKRFATGAMSLGSISTESHETLAIAMNRLGGRSNTGEGGEDPAASARHTATCAARRSSRSPPAASV